MIKLFRNIRKNLLNEGKTSKYFKYAIGEIVLVVIGILIALQINNWNENRKQKDVLHGIYDIIKRDISNDIIEIDSFVINFETIRKPSFEAVLNSNISREDYLKHPEYFTVLSGFKDFAINQRGFDLLKTQSNNIKNGKNELSSKISSFYNQHLVEINVASIEIMREFISNMNENKKCTWFSSYLLNKDTSDAIDYLMNDPLERNRITVYYMVYRIYVNELRKFKTNGEAIIKQIDQIDY